MFFCRYLPALCLLFLLNLGGNSAYAADGINLTGTYAGSYTNKGRNKRRVSVNLRVKQNGQQFDGAATDNTLWVTGLVVEDKVFIEWEHASGERGEGIMNILDAGMRLEGDWKSASDGSHYGVWEFTRQ